MSVALRQAQANDHISLMGPEALTIGSWSLEVDEEAKVCELADNGSVKLMNPSAIVIGNHAQAEKSMDLSPNSSWNGKMYEHFIPERPYVPDGKQLPALVGDAPGGRWEWHAHGGAIRSARGAHRHPSATDAQHPLHFLDLGVIGTKLRCHGRIEVGIRVTIGTHGPGSLVCRQRPFLFLRFAGFGIRFAIG